MAVCGQRRRRKPGMGGAIVALMSLCWCTMTQEHYRPSEAQLTADVVKSLERAVFAAEFITWTQTAITPPALYLAQCRAAIAVALAQLDLLDLRAKETDFYASRAAPSEPPSPVCPDCTTDS